MSPVGSRREIRWVRIRVTRFGMTNESDRSFKWFERKYPTLEAKVEAIRSGMVAPLDAYRQPMPESEAIGLLYAREGVVPEGELSPTGKVETGLVPPDGDSTPHSEPLEESARLRQEIEDLKQIVRAISGQEEGLTSEFLQSLSRSLKVGSSGPEAGRPIRQIFLSYFREDYLGAARLHEELTDAGYSVWWDDDLLGGEDWEEAARAAMDQSDAILLTLSREGLGRSPSPIHPEVHTTLKMLKELEPRPRLLIPLRLSDCEIPPIPVEGKRLLSSLRAIDLFPEEQWGLGIQRLLRSLSRRDRPRGSSGANNRT